MVRIVCPRTFGSPLQDVGRVHTQDAELASSAKFLETRIGEDMARRPLPDIDYCVFAHTTCSHRSTATDMGSWTQLDAALVSLTCPFAHGMIGAAPRKAGH
jgi:hypothetical protein